MPRDDDGSMAEDEGVDGAVEEPPADDGDPSDDATVVEDAEDADDAKDTEDTEDTDDAPKLVAVVLLLGGALEDSTTDELLAADVPLPAAEPGPLSTDEASAREEEPVEESREDVDPALELPSDAAPPDDVELVPTAPEPPPPGSTGVPQPTASTIRLIHARDFTLPPVPMRPTKQAPCRATPARWNAALPTRVTSGVTFWVTDLVTASFQQVGPTRTPTSRHDWTRTAVPQAPP